jgi:glycosyltransferase involved in cell wall biosynthesis
MQDVFVFNGRFLSRPVTGVERFATETLRALDHNWPDWMPGLRMVVAIPKGTPQRLPLKHATYMEVGRLQGHAWEQLELARFLPDARLVSLCNTAPIFRAKQSVVIHDAAVFSLPHAYGWKFRLAYKLLHHALARSGAKLLTVSEFSRKELHRWLKVPEHDIAVLPEGGDHATRWGADDDILSKHDLLRRPYVLAVSSNHLGKNFSLVARTILTLEDPGFDVVVAGGGNAAVFTQQGVDLPSFVKRVGYVSDEALASLYRHAACFVFPSIYEGFGLPPLEAMTLGCPVLASTAGSIPEVCGDAAMYFDPASEASLKGALHEVMGQPALSKQVAREKSLRQSGRWTWEKAGMALATHLKDAAGTGPGSR